jgi:esterase/lipase superfamily enzyme
MPTTLQHLWVAIALILVAAEVDAAALIDNVRYDLAIQRGLVAAGALQRPAGSASREELEEAIARYREVFGATDDVKAIQKCDEDLRQAFGFKHDGTFEGRSLQLPTALLKATKEGNANEAYYRSADEAVFLYTFRFNLRQNPPIELLHAILAKARAPTIHSLDQSSHGFAIRISDHVRATDKLPTRHQLKKAFAAGGKVTGVYFTFLDDPASDFTPAGCMTTVATYWTPPIGLFSGTDDVRRLEQVKTWTKSRKLSSQQELDALALAQSPPDMRTDEAVQSMVVRWAWRATMSALANIVTEQFETTNRWRDVEVQNCYVDPNAVSGAKTVRVVFATNREMNPWKAQSQLGAWVDNSVESENALSVGCASIAVAQGSVSSPEDISAEEVGGGGSVAAAQEFSVAQTAPPSKQPAAVTAYQLRLLDKERGWFRNEDRALVFIHGYNTTFESAILRAAQIAARTDYDGRVFLFSWPTATWWATYLPDLDSAERSEFHLTGFLRAILSDPEIKTIDVVAHSMGSQMLVRSLNDLRDVFYARHNIKLGQVLFAAPDVSSDVFAEKLREIAGLAQRVTVYGSSEDKALMFSSALRGGSPRIGLIDDGKFPQIGIDGIDFIDASALTNICNVWGLSTMDHGYFSQSPVMLKHMAAVLSLKEAGRALRSTYVSPSGKGHSVLKAEEPHCWFNR